MNLLRSGGIVPLARHSQTLSVRGEKLADMLAEMFPVLIRFRGENHQNQSHQ